AATRHRDRVSQALAGQSACVLVDDLDAALAVADAWAPEHLEIQAEDAPALAARVRNAGAVFVAPLPPSRSATTSPGPITCCPPAGPPATPAGCRCCPSCGACTWWSAPAPRSPRPPRTSTRWPRPRTCPPMPPPSGPACPVMGARHDGSRLAAAAA